MSTWLRNSQWGNRFGLNRPRTLQRPDYFVLRQQVPLQQVFKADLAVALLRNHLFPCKHAFVRLSPAYEYFQWHSLSAQPEQGDWRESRNGRGTIGEPT